MKAAIFSVITSAAAWVFLFATAGFVCLTLGINIIVGPGWALIASGVVLLVCAWFLQLGIARG